MDWATVGDWVIKVGIPSSLGVFLVVYLVRYIIPQHLAAFTQQNADTRSDFIKALGEQRSDFIKTLADQRADHIKKMELVTNAHTNGNTAINTSLHELTVELNGLRAAMARIEGVIAGKASKD
jgi:hypothetical protein